MIRVSVKEARSRFSDLLSRVAAGEEVIVSRRGRDVATMTQVRPRGRQRLPALEQLRSSIVVHGEPLSAEVQRGREEARF